LIVITNANGWQTIFKWGQVLLFACIWIMLGKLLLLKLCLYKQKQKAKPDPTKYPQ